MGRVGVLEAGCPDGPALVLVHGLGGVAEEVLPPLAPGLATLGLRAIAVDRPGYGRSDPIGPAPGPAAQARWLAEVLDRMGVSRPILLGHSFGAAVALWLARELGSGAAGLLLVNPFCRPTRPAAAPLMRLAVAPVVGAPVRRRLAPAVATAVVRWSFAKACAPDPVPPGCGLPCRLITQESALLAMAAELRAFNADMARLAREGATIAAPARAIFGCSDRVIEGAAHAEWLRLRFGIDTLKAPGGHMLHHTRTGIVLAEIARLRAAASLAHTGAAGEGP